MISESPEIIILYRVLFSFFYDFYEHLFIVMKCMMNEMSLPVELS